MPDLTFNCSYCGVKIEANSTLAGKIIQCPKCSHAVKVSQGLMRENMVLGGYTLEKLLGKGGMGEVWLATQTSMGRKVGLKILAHGLSKDPEFIARFNQEMKLVAKLDHPGIVSAYEAGYDKGFYFLATSYVNGATLESKIDDGKIFSEEEALAIIGKVAEALKYAWGKHKILHRDIKPANIMIDDNGDVKLMDMGISKSLLVEDKSITMTGSILGTPYYMSPEQAKAEKDIDHRSDIYSLGSTLYHMLTGRFPYNATTSLGVLARMISENVVSVRRINPSISVKCEKMIAKMMEKDKSKRYAAWQDVIDDIGKIRDGKVSDDKFSESIKDRFLKLKMSPSLIALLVIGTAAVLLIFLIMEQGGKEPGISEISIEDISPETGYAESNQVSQEPKEDIKSDRVPKVTTDNSRETVKGQYSNPKNSDDNIKKSSQINPDSFDDKKTVGNPMSEPAPIPEVKKNEPPVIPNFKKELSEKLGIPEDRALLLIPILRTYARELKQLRDNAPPKGYKFNELRENIHEITRGAKQKADTVLTREQSEKFIMFLEQERRHALRNNLWRMQGPGMGNR
jgi:serine/threonine-protein kinase